VPNDPGPSSWVAGQYQKFIEGLELVGTSNAPRLARVEAPVRVDRPKEPQITIPAWGDIIRTGPRTIVTPEDYAVHRHFEKAGLRSPLAPEIQQEIADRRAMARRIGNSAIPEYQRGVATMMTAVDNVQDSALTIAVGARISVTALGRFGNWMAPAVTALSTVARVVGWLGLALSAFGILYALACQGPRHALAQWRSMAMAGYLFRGARAVVPRARGIPTPIPTAGAKGARGIAMFGVPSGREVANHRASRWARARPSFGELLQIGQVAYDHLGYGLALGAIIGFSAETSYAGARKQQGENVSVRSPQVNHVLARILSSRVAGLRRGALWHRHQCARALASSLFILRDPSSWGDELYGLTWVVVYASLEPLMWDTQGLKWRDPVIDHLGDARWTPWDVADPVTRMILEDEGVDMSELRFPLPGSPAELDAERIVLELGKEIGDALARWLEEDALDPWRRFVAEMSMYVTERLWWWLEGAADWPAWKLAPSTAVWESLMIASRWPIVSDPPELIMRAWAACEQWVRDTGAQMIPAEVLDGIWNELGVPLLRLRGFPGPVPAEFTLPWDEQTGEPADAVFGRSILEARTRQAEFLAEQARRAKAAETPGTTP